MLLAVPAVFFAPGCQGRECESDGFKDYGYGAGEGHLVDANTWETTPNAHYADGTLANWLPFGPYHTWVIHPVGLEGRDLLLTQVYYSADPDPNDPGNNYTTAAGNGATVGVSSDSRAVFVTNSTCAPTYIRVVIVADPLPPSGPNLDAGAAAAAASDEGGVDASSFDADTLDASDAGD